MIDNMKIISKLFYGLVAFSIMLPLGNTFAWSAKGHVIISQLTYKKLSKEKKVILDKYAKVLLQELPYPMEMQLYDNYHGASNFAKLTVLPDRWRDLTLAKIFNKFSAKLPKDLSVYSKLTTNSWHYQDLAYPKNLRCKSNGHLAFAIKILQDSFFKEKDENSRALILLFMVHLVEDAYQPLHTISHTDIFCKNDSGGNKYMIIIGKKHVISLHKLWDQGVGLFSKSIKYNKIYKISKKTLANKSLNISDFDFELCCQQNYAYSKFIYSISPYKKVNSKYYQQGQKIVRHQIIKARDTLVKILQRFLSVSEGANS